MLTQVLARKLPTTVCTVYNPRFDDPLQQEMCEVGISLLNEIIVTEAQQVSSMLFSLMLFC